jgi:ABC-2 type transport system ATP-binding protein
MLEAHELAKNYSGIPAVSGMSFTLKPGEILGCLGPNGSGKSTTVKMLVGLLEPTRGHITMNGVDLRDDPVAYKRRVGYVPEEATLYTYLSGREYLQLVGRLRGLDGPVLERKIGGLLELFGLTDARHTAMAGYSKGMRQKVLIASALLHDPDALVLDEPFSGLDVTMTQVLKTLLAELAAAGKMVFYSSHVLEVVEKVCSRIIILHRGRVVANDSVEHLRTLMTLPSLEAIFSELVRETDPGSVARDILSVVRGDGSKP